MFALSFDFCFPFAPNISFSRMDHTLTKEEIGRYSRQLLVNDFGVKGQEGLKTAKVLIIGAGGLGCPVAVYLAGSGIGTLGIVDYDEVSIDNLHRQVAHKESCVGIPKTASLKATIQGLNHFVHVNCHNVLLTKDNAMDIFAQYDIAVDCSDNPATRYLVNDACVLLKKPLVSGSALRWEGQMTVYNHGEATPCYRCLFPAPPDVSLVTNCSEGGVLGPVVGIIGSFQALEVVKIAAGLQSSYCGKMLVFDGLAGKTRVVEVRKRRPECVICGTNATIKALIDYSVFCGAAPTDKAQSVKILNEDERVTVQQYQKVRKTCDPYLLDTRPPHEFHIAALPEAKNVTLSDVKKCSPHDILQRLAIGIYDTPDVYVICHRGNDSQLAVQLLKEKLHGCNVRDVRGGYQAWSEEIDHDFPQY